MRFTAAIAGIVLSGAYVASAPLDGYIPAQGSGGVDEAKPLTKEDAEFAAQRAQIEAVGLGPRQVGQPVNTGGGSAALDGEVLSNIYGGALGDIIHKRQADDVYGGAGGSMSGGGISNKRQLGQGAYTGGGSAALDGEVLSNIYGGALGDIVNKREADGESALDKRHKKHHKGKHGEGKHHKGKHGKGKDHDNEPKEITTAISFVPTTVIAHSPSTTSSTISSIPTAMASSIDIDSTDEATKKSVGDVVRELGLTVNPMAVAYNKGTTVNANLTKHDLDAPLYQVMTGMQLLDEAYNIGLGLMAEENAFVQVQKRSMNYSNPSTKMGLTRGAQKTSEFLTGLDDAVQAVVDVLNKANQVNDLAPKSPLTPMIVKLKAALNEFTAAANAVEKVQAGQKSIQGVGVAGATIAKREAVSDSTDNLKDDLAATATEFAAELEDAAIAALDQIRAIILSKLSEADVRVVAKAFAEIIASNFNDKAMGSQASKLDAAQIASLADKTSDLLAATLSRAYDTVVVDAEKVGEIFMAELQASGVNDMLHAAYV